MTGIRIRLAALVAIVAGEIVSGCGAPTPVRRFLADPDGSSVATGGDDATSPADTSPSTGGVDGTGGGGSGGQAETGGAGGPDASSGGQGGSAGSVGETADASAGGRGGASDSSGTGGSGTGGGPGVVLDAGSTTRPDAGYAVPGDGTTAACFTDPTVIAICKQLEPACQNCPDRSIWDECFDVAAAGDDRACARYAVANKCTVDVGGNACGSLNCRAAGCNRSACLAAQGEGDTTMCEPLMKTCPCK
jgi:hypothetical protein